MFVCAALLIACGEEANGRAAPPLADANEQRPPAVAAEVPAPAPSAPQPSSPAATPPLLASDDDDAGDPAAPRKHVRGTLALPDGAALPAGTRVVGLRRVWLANIATLRAGTWQRAPRAEVDAAGRFDLSVPGHWNTLILYADAPALLDEPLLRLAALPPPAEPRLVAKPGAALVGTLARHAGPCTGQGDEELARVRVSGAFGAREVQVAPGGAFELVRLPHDAALELVLDSSGHAPLALPLTLQAAERRELGVFGAPLARVEVGLVDERGAAVAGAACALGELARTTDANGRACVPLAPQPPARFSAAPPAGSGLLPLAGRVETAARAGWRLVTPAARSLRLRVQDADGRALAGASVRVAPRVDAFEGRSFPLVRAFGARADATGAIELDGLYPAAYELELWSGAAPDRAVLRASLEHAPNDDERVVKLTPVESSRVALRVLTAERNPWPEYRIRIFDVEELELGLADTLDGRGADAWLSLPAGRWSVRARDDKPGGPTARIELELPRDAARVHELVLTR